MTVRARAKATRSTRAVTRSCNERHAVENAGKIHSSDANALFEPLRRGSGAHQSNERSNLGPGLFITRQIARAHGGDVELHSEGGMVRFTLVLPKTESQPAAPLQERKKVEA